jgi:hypothetical protein
VSRRSDNSAVVEVGAVVEVEVEVEEAAAVQR